MVGIVVISGKIANIHLYIVMEGVKILNSAMFMGLFRGFHGSN